MSELKILKDFFDEQHRKHKEHVHTIYQCTCGTLAVHSEYSEWLKHKNHGSLDPSQPQDSRNGTTRRD